MICKHMHEKASKLEEIKAMRALLERERGNTSELSVAKNVWLRYFENSYIVDYIFDYSYVYWAIP